MFLRAIVIHYVLEYAFYCGIETDRQAVGRQIDRRSGRRKAFSGRHVVGGQGTTGSLIK